MSAARLSPLFTWRARICDEDSPLPSTVRLVALVLSLHMSERGDSCFPGIPRLSRESGLDRRTIQRSIARLESGGYLVVERPALTKGRGAPNRYRATVPEVSFAPFGGRVSDDRPSVSDGRSSCDRRAGLDPEKGGPRPPEDVKQCDSKVVDEKSNNETLTEAGRALAREVVELARQKAMGA